MTRITINRAPVLTLWAAVVAERLGFERDEALSLARVVTGLTAHAKGVRLGIIEPTPAELRAQRKKPAGEMLRIALLGRAVPAVSTPDGIRGLAKDAISKPEAAQRYIDKNFAGHAAEAHRVMAELAKSVPVDRLAREAFRMYEQFRPEVPAGTAGWGAKGTLDLAKIAKLAE
jgi:hypothetical protein